MHPDEVESGTPSTPLSGELFDEIVRRVTDMLSAVEQGVREIPEGSPACQLPVSEAACPPLAPESLAESGLSPGLVASLVLKWSSIQTQVTEALLVDLVRLPVNVLHEVFAKLCAEGALESSPETEQGARWRMTDSGKRRAAAAFSECRYLGPAPVSKSQYLARCEQDAVGKLRFHREQLKTGLKPLVIGPEILDSIGAGLCNGHSILLHGESGNGKTAIARKIGELVKATGGPIYVPDAIAVDNRIITLFDPDFHKPVQANSLEQNVNLDQRWRLVERPFVSTAISIQPHLFDIPAQHGGQVLHAPIHLKANGGVLLLDNLGRQRQLPEIADRWLRILEQQADTFLLGTEREVTLPVTCLTLFVTHHTPAESFDSTLLRRIRSKVNIVPPDEYQFREIFRNLCSERGIHYDDWVVLRCLNHRYNLQISPKASDPRDLLDAIAASCRFEGESPRLTEDLLAQAFQRTVMLNESSV